MKTLDPISILRERCAKSNQKQVAAELGVSPSYLSDVLLGRKEPGASILEPLGLRRKPIEYEPIPKSERGR